MCEYVYVGIDGIDECVVDLLTFHIVVIEVDISFQKSDFFRHICHYAVGTAKSINFVDVFNLQQCIENKPHQWLVAQRFEVFPGNAFTI